MRNYPWGLRPEQMQFDEEVDPGDIELVSEDAVDREAAFANAAFERAVAAAVKDGKKEISSALLASYGEDPLYYGRVTRISLPESVTSIGAYAFNGCSSLKEIEMPGVRHIGRSAFERCVSLEELDLPDGLKSVGELAFRRCGGLKSVYVPESVQQIAFLAFEDCPKLEAVYLAGRGRDEVIGHAGRGEFGTYWPWGVKDGESVFVYGNDVNAGDVELVDEAAGEDDESEAANAAYRRAFDAVVGDRDSVGPNILDRAHEPTRYYGKITKIGLPETVSHVQAGAF